MIRNAVATCEYCSGLILRGAVAGRRNRHCSLKCRSAGTRQIKPEALRAAVLRGETLVAMARQFRVNRATISKWLELDGLVNEWRSHRFKKHVAVA